MTSANASVQQPAPKTSRWRSVYDTALPPAACMLGIVILWEAFVRVAGIQPFVLPAPSQVVLTAVEWRTELAAASLVTLTETVVGFLLAVAFGIPLAIMTVQWSLLRKTIYPILLILQSVPKVAIAPILVIWVGFGAAPKILIALLVCFFPIFIDSATGFASTSREHLDLARSLQAGRLQIFWKFRFPHALPHIFVGMKVGITLAVIGAVVGEFVQSNSGLGYLILVSSTQSNTALGFAAIVLLSLISIALFYLLEGLEYILVPWAEE